MDVEYSFRMSLLEALAGVLRKFKDIIAVIEIARTDTPYDPKNCTTNSDRKRADYMRDDACGAPICGAGNGDCDCYAA